MYGFNVMQGKIVDTILLAKMAKFKGTYPTTVQVDSIISILKAQVLKSHAKQNGYPMLHVVNNEPGVYDMQVALPVDRVIPETAE